MKTLSRFVAKFTSLIVAVLSCFDRVIFKGYLPITNSAALEGFVDHVLKIPRKDFMKFAERQSETLVEHGKRLAQEVGAEYRYLQGTHRKDKLVDEILRKRPISEGLICVLCCMECCPSFRLIFGKGRPNLANARRQQRVLYFYFLDPQLGQIYIRLTTWFPFTAQVYVNGHSWLAQQMLRRRLGFSLQDNAFTALDDPQATQKLADSFAKLNWAKILNRLVRQVNPLMNERWFRNFSYYWVVDQAEFATDLIFTSREALAGLYPRLLNHAAVNFSAREIMSFLGRRFHPRFDGEVLTDCQKGRWPGARVKHRMKNNWLKMYDKFGLVLRIETVINNPREFRVRRLRMREGCPEMVWCPMNKGVINLYRYREVSLAANERYLEALSVVEDPTPAYRQVEELTEPVVVTGRSLAGFNPASKADIKLFTAVLDGNHLVRGFRNAEIREALYGSNEDRSERRRQSRRGGSDVEAVARTWTDRQGAPHPSVAGQSERPSVARSHPATLPLWNPSGGRSGGMIRRKDGARRGEVTEVDSKTQVIDQLRISLITVAPSTPVSLASRPWNLTLKASCSMPSWWSIVAWRSCTVQTFSTAAYPRSSVAPWTIPP